MRSPVRMAVIFSCSTDGSNPAALCRRGCCRTRLLIPPGWAAGDSGGVGGAAAFESSELCGSPEIVEGFLCRFRLGPGFPDFVVDG